MRISIKVILSFVGCALLAASSLPAHAAFMYDVVFDSGPAPDGLLTIDVTPEPTAGTQGYTPTGGSAGTIVEFTVEIGTKTFSALDDNGYPSFPFVIFTDAVLTLVDYEADTGNETLGVFFNAAVPSNMVVYDDESGDTSTGRLVVAAAPPPQVPEPATLALMGLGLAGIGYSRRRRHIATQNR